MPAQALTYRAIVCAVSGSRDDDAAVRQAAVLAGSDAALELVAVARRARRGAGAQAAHTSHAAHALALAASAARDAGGRPIMRRIDAADEREALLREASTHDLVVLGSAPGSRVGGIATGRSATAVVHRADCDVLVARPAPTPFPACIVVADNGTETSERAVRLAVAIAAAHGAQLMIAAPARRAAAGRERIAAHAAAVAAAGARAPVVVDVAGRAHEAIPQLAERLRASLIVIGSRRLHGAAALASVSERVAHRAPCSVLIARGTDAAPTGLEAPR